MLLDVITILFLLEIQAASNNVYFNYENLMISMLTLVGV